MIEIHFANQYIQSSLRSEHMWYNNAMLYRGMNTHVWVQTRLNPNIYTACIKMIGAVWKLIISTSMVNRIIYISSNERLILQVYDTSLQMFDVCTVGHTAHIEATVQFLPHSDQHVRCDGPALVPLQRHPVV